MLRSIRVMTAALGLMLVPMAACSSNSTSSHSTGSSAAAATSVSDSQIVIDNFKYSPETLTVKAGQTITVVNKDSTAHTLTASAGKTFDTGTIMPGKSGTFTAPGSPGSYPYICTIHQFMHGILVVK